MSDPLFNNEANVNFNHADCLRTVADFGKNTVHNICNGNLTEVPWGSADWALAVFLLALGASFTVLLGAMVLSVLSGRY